MVKKQKLANNVAKNLDFSFKHVPALAVANWGSAENQANADKALCKMPPELMAEILSYYDAVGPLTSVIFRGWDEGTHVFPNYDGPVLPTRYLERPDTLRALSQTCIAFRRIFLPILWERLEVCVGPRNGTTVFHKHLGETLIRKATGLLENPDLAAMVRRVHVSLTRYQTHALLPPFTQCLLALPNFHTMHILHAHTQMTTALRVAFEGSTLSTVRTIISPGYCHEILRCCPEVRTVWCTRDNGSKLLTAITKSCKNVQEIRGFNCEREKNLMKRLIKAAPNLRVLEVNPDPSDEVLELMSKLRKLSTIDILSSNMSEDKLQPTIKKLRPILKASSSTERKYLRICKRKCGVSSTEESFVDVGIE